MLRELLAVLEGRRGLRITNVNAEAPFTFMDLPSDEPDVTEAET